MPEPSSPAPHGFRWWLAWAAVGAAYVFGLLAIATIGLVVLLAAALAMIPIARQSPGRRPVWGLASGAALPLFYVAWLNRGGPGWVCTRTPTSESCAQQWSPWPWVAVGVALLVAGLAGFAWRRLPAAQRH